MKHLFISALMATACTLGASAQSVVVTDADGVAHKFSAERVKDITFIKTSASDVTEFSTVDARIYSSGAVEATFTGSNVSKSVTLWIVGPSMGKYLYEGVYKVSAEYGEMTIDSDKYSTYVTENGTNTAVTDGTMNVALSGKVYTITFDLTLADGNSVKGKYVGEMPGKVGKDITLPDMDTPTVLTTEVNDYVPGEFYVKGNDSSWNYETAFDFFADASSTKLPSGTYTYSADNAPGTFGSKSYLDIYNPSCSYRFAEGSTATVSYEGDNIVMAFRLLTNDGRTIELGYTGAITFPEVTPPSADVTEFTAVDARVYSSGSVEATFTGSATQKSVTLWIVGPSMGKYFYDGDYTVASSGEMIIDSDKNYSFVTENGVTTALSSGTMNVAISGKVYTITFDLTLADGNSLEGKYEGEMPGKVGKNITLPDMDTPAVLTTEVNDYVPGEFYVKGNDSSWNYETAFDFFADASSTKLPAGTYTYSTAGTPGTFGSKSYLDIYSPSCSYRFAEGSTATVSYEGDNIVLAFKLLTDDGRTIELGYTGAITFPEVEQQKETLAIASAAAAKAVDVNGRVAGEYYIKMNDSSWNYEMAVDLYADASTTKLPAGTYTYSADNSAGTFGSKSYIDLYTPNLGSCRFGEGSTVTVSYEGDNVKMEFNLQLADKDYVVTMTYEGPITYEF